MLRDSDALKLREAYGAGAAAYGRLWAGALAPAAEARLRRELKRAADVDAVAVFADNLRDLLLAAPLGARPVLGLDPGLRTGVKCAALDASGAFREGRTIYPLRGRAQAAEAERALLELVAAHQPAALRQSSA